MVQNNQGNVNNIYKKVISTLSNIEMVVDNPKQFSIIRKQMLDIANDILRLGDNNGK